jgi:hypothetical protein
LPSMSHPIGITKASRDLIKIAKEGQGQTIWPSRTFSERLFFF